MNVAMIGTGRVGLVAASCLADFGIRVCCVDNRNERIDCLREGRMPFHEPGLAELVHKNTQAGRLSFSTDVAEAVAPSLVIFIAVGTEEESRGRANLCPFFEVARQVARGLKEYKVLVVKSTVPVGTARRLTAELKKETGVGFGVVSNPEFLREGSAIEHFMRPDRVILGGRSEQALAIVRDVYRPLYLIETPFVITDNETAEMLCYTYLHLHRLPVVCVRLLSVYGPRQRPDLAVFRFTELMEAGNPLPVFGDGMSGRDYTYVDDIVAGILAGIACETQYDVFDLGNSHPVKLLDLIRRLEKATGLHAEL